MKILENFFQSRRQILTLRGVYLIEIKASSMCKCLYIQAITMTRVINSPHIEAEE